MPDKVSKQTYLLLEIYTMVKDGCEVSEIDNKMEEYRKSGGFLRSLHEIKVKAA